MRGAEKQSIRGCSSARVWVLFLRLLINPIVFQFLRRFAGQKVSLMPMQHSAGKIRKWKIALGSRFL
jgi:hypothetical protein